MHVRHSKRRYPSTREGEIGPRGPRSAARARPGLRWRLPAASEPPRWRPHASPPGTGLPSGQQLTGPPPVDMHVCQLRILSRPLEGHLGVSIDRNGPHGQLERMSEHQASTVASWVRQPMEIFEGRTYLIKAQNLLTRTDET